MTKHRFSRRDVLKAPQPRWRRPSLLRPLRAAAPEASAITPALVEAAKKEGKLAFYTAMDLAFAERLAKTFEAKYPRHRGRGSSAPAPSACSPASPRNTASNIHAVDVVNTADQAHCIVWKRNGWLAPYLPEEVAQALRPAILRPGRPARRRRAMLVSPIGYNTNLVKTEDAPKSFADLLDPKWAGKMVKAHPAYSGTIMNATFQIARDLGWGYLEKLAKQRVLQVQSATDTPKKIALGERAVMVDGAGYLVIRDKEARPAGRDRLSRARARRSPPVRARCSRRRPIRTRRACSRTGCTRARASSSWSIGRASIRRIARPWRSPASASSPTSS